MHHRRRPLLEALEPRQLLSTVTVANATASESAGALTFHVTFDSPSTHDVTLNYVTTPDANSATPNKDYRPARGKLTLPAGQTEGDITVTLKNDSLYETTESFRLNLAATGAKLAKAFAKGTITDDDPAPTVTFKDVTTKEGNAGQHFVTLTVSLSKPAGSPLTFKYATSDDTPHSLAATAGSDYTAASGTVTFVPGQTKQAVRVAVRGDTTSESDESFRVTLSYHGTDVAAAGVTIKDDDKAAKSDAPLLSISDATALEGDAGTSQAAVTVTLSKPSNQDVTFHYQTVSPETHAPGANGNLTLTAAALSSASLDYVPSSGTITIPAGQTSASIPVTLVGDTTYEPNQTFQVNVSNVTHARPINGRTAVSSDFNVIDDEPVLYADSAGNYVAAPSGFARPSDQFVSLYNTGAVTLPVVYSQSLLVASPASATLSAARFPDVAVVSVAPNAYVFTSAFTGAASLTLSSSAAATASGQLLSGATLSLARSTIDTSAFAKTGAGTLTLSGTNTYTAPASFSGGTLVVTAPSYLGDANLNGTINADDYALLDRGFTTTAHPTSGDFNYDGVVTSADYLLIDTTYNHQGTNLSPDVLAQREAEFGSDYVTPLVASVQPSTNDDSTPPATDGTPDPNATTASADPSPTTPPNPSAS